MQKDRFSVDGLGVFRNVHVRLYAFVMCQERFSVDGLGVFRNVYVRLYAFTLSVQWFHIDESGSQSLSDPLPAIEPDQTRSDSLMINLCNCVLGSDTLQA